MEAFLYKKEAFMARKVPSKWSETFNSALKCVRFQFRLEGEPECDHTY